MEDLRERIAEALYHNDGGMSDEEYIKVTGKARRLWKTDAPWDTDPNELCEWERDEYRQMADAAIAAGEEETVVEKIPKQNLFMVGMSADKSIRLMRAKSPMTREEAINLAAWIIVLTEGEQATLALVEAIENG